MRGLYGFDDADEALTFMPTAARRALDLAGRKLSLSAWQSMSIEDKRKLIELGADDRVDIEAVRTMLKGTPAIDPISDPVDAPAGIDARKWSALKPLDRYALVKSARKPEKLERAIEEILGNAEPRK